MADSELQELRKSVQASLARIQDFKPKRLPQVKRLGSEINFEIAIEPAETLIGLYAQLPLEVVDVLPTNPLKSIQTQADSDYKRFSDILEFQTEQGNVIGRVEALVKALENAYAPAFEKLHPWISYSVRRSTDFTKLEQEARATIQQMRDKAAKVESDLAVTQTESQAILEEVRKVAEEQGVSQQAIYFKKEAEQHDENADTWLKTTKNFAWALGIYAVGSIYLHELPYVSIDTTYEAIQLAVSKVLIFAVLSYMLVLSARNFLSQRHNAIINKHRQNALMTFEALVKAGKDSGNRDIVLAQAAECIFEPKPTGYAKSTSADSSTVKSLIGLVSSGTSQG